MDKYVLFGAGYYGMMAIEYIGKDKVEYFVDNDLNKDGKTLWDIPVYLFKNRVTEIKANNYVVVISVKPESQDTIKHQLSKNGIRNTIVIGELLQNIVREKENQNIDFEDIYGRAIMWIQSSSVKNKGIINNTRQPLPYPEVTGYFIPTLLRFGHRELAIEYAKWLCSIQKEDGSWWDTYDKEPYIFDTAQILKGLIAIRDLLEVDGNIISGCDWILSSMNPDGGVPAINEEVWGDGGTLSELIHLYTLSPIKEAGEIFGKHEYINAVKKSLDYYLSNYRDKILDFHLLSHFYAYIVEALVDLGEMDLAKEAMVNVASIQRKDGFVPGYKDVNWVCSTGLFQFALIWYRIGEFERGEKAFTYACKLQNTTGGWYGSYPSDIGIFESPGYLPAAEISWAVKYFLDALYYRKISRQ